MNVPILLPHFRQRVIDRLLSHIPAKPPGAIIAHRVERCSGAALLGGHLGNCLDKDTRSKERTFGKGIGLSA